MRSLNVKARLYRLWELLVIRYVLITGHGKRRREWIHYRRSMGGRKAAVTRKRNRAARVGAAEGNQAGAAVSASFTPPGQSAAFTPDPRGDGREWDAATITRTGEL